MAVEHVSHSGIIRSLRKERFEKTIWSQNEHIFKNRLKYVNPSLVSSRVPFSDVSEVILRKSLFGIYLDEYNSQENQDKFLNANKFDISKYEYKRYDASKKTIICQRNTFTENVYSLLKKAVLEEDKIDFDFLYKNVECLRIVDTPLNYIDKSLRNFCNLQVLVLCGNWINDIRGINLPRKLRFLEVYGNRLGHLRNFAKKAPKYLVHLGFRRNKLTAESGLDLLGNRDNFSRLRSLDLADNDIYKLQVVLDALAPLKEMLYLVLEGNPCSVICTYKDDVLAAFPCLKYLDNAEILQSDRISVTEDEPQKIKAAVVFTCHRIMGLPPPPKQKGVIQTFQIEVTLPLLEELTIEPESVEPPETPEFRKSKVSVLTGKSKNTKASKPSKSSKTDKSSKKGKGGGKKGKAQSVYDAPDEYESDCKLKNNSFKTERFPWSKIIQLPEEALVIESYYGNLTDVRDTFRSSVNVKLIYYKIEPPNTKKKKGKEKKKKKGKGDSKKTKKGQAEVLEPKVEVPPEEPHETILKKVTLANFWCDLHHINWSEKTIDYYWADHPKATPRAIPVTGSLRHIDYDEKASAKKGAKNVVTNDDEKKELIPRIFTCQVGIGLLRN